MTLGTRTVPTTYTVALVLALALAARPLAAADDAQADAAREVFKKHQDAVVWVTAVIKMRGGGGPLAAMMGQQEQKVEAVGTVIHESGLTVVSHTNIDPTSLINAAYGDIKLPGQEGKIEFKSELSGVKIRLADGAEVPARLVMTDEDLDLAFILPTDKNSRKLPFVNLAGAGEGAAKELAVMDPLTVLGRLDQTLDRQPAVYPTRVNAVVKKPRTFYVCSDIESLGTPAFDRSGRPVGIVVMRKQSGAKGMGSLMSSASGGDMAAVIIPGQDVMEVAQQALTKKAEIKQEPKEPADEKENAPKPNPGRRKADK